MHQVGDFLDLGSSRVGKSETCVSGCAFAERRCEDPGRNVVVVVDFGCGFIRIRGASPSRRIERGVL